MNADSEKQCLDEMDHLIIDNDKKVTLKYIANNWNIPFKDGEIVLEKWLKKYSGDRKIAKKYLIRGVHNGNPIITVIPEKTLPEVEKICPNHVRTLFSIEISSLNGKSLNIEEPTTNKFIGLRIKRNKRNIKVNQIAVPPAEKSIKKQMEPPKKAANPFGAVSLKPQPKEAEIDKKAVNGLKDLKIKDENSSPKKNQPVKNAKAPQGKSSIASFFAKPSTSSTPRTEKLAPDAPPKIESVDIKKDTIQSKVENGTKIQKRPHPNTSDSNEESKSGKEKKTKVQAKKKMKLEPKSASSRLMQICDSSSDEEDASDRKDALMDTEDEPIVKKEKENKTPSPEKSDANRSAGTSSGKRRAKVKKMVTKTYEDEDGFINTVREVAEISCSDEEPEIVEPPPKKPATFTNKDSSTTSKKKVSPSKKKVSPPAGKKQGSILSFFAKK